MKKILAVTALLLILLLPLSVLAGTAVTLDATVSVNSGRSVIRWTPGDLPAGGYKVYVSAVNPGGSAELVQLAGTTDGSSLTTGLLAPNRTYKVYVTNTDNIILGSAVYITEDVPVFEDGKLKHTSVKISTEPRRLNNATGKFKKLKSFKASEMESTMASEPDTYFCMKYLMRMPKLIKARAFFVQVVFDAPNGYSYTEKAEDVTFDKVKNGYQTLWWDRAGANFFSQLYSQTGSIPAGEYTITLYWDGCFVNTTTFKVN